MRIVAARYLPQQLYAQFEREAKKQQWYADCGLARDGVWSLPVSVYATQNTMYPPFRYRGDTDDLGMD